MHGFRSLQIGWVKAEASDGHELFVGTSFEFCEQSTLRLSFAVPFQFIAFYGIVHELGFHSSGCRSSLRPTDHVVSLKLS